MADIDWNFLVSKPESELLGNLGVQLRGLAASTRPDSADSEIGLRWLLSNTVRLREILCGVAAVKSAGRGKHWDRIALCTAVFDALIAYYKMPFSMTLTALIARQGVLELCDEIWCEQK